MIRGSLQVANQLWVSYSLCWCPLFTLGTRIYNTLVDFIKHQYIHRGYTEVCALFYLPYVVLTMPHPQSLASLPR